MKTIFMPKVMKEAWINALRSGRYKQGKKALKTIDGEYCCLGVLQMVVSGEVETYKYIGSLILPSYEWLRANGILFYDSNRTEDQHPYLSSLNLHAEHANDIGYSFTQIADAIEEAWQEANTEEVPRPE